MTQENRLITVLKKPIGASGTDIADGYIYEEFNSKLDGTNGIEEYYKMKRTDGTVSGVLRQFKMPILQVDKFVQKVVDEDNQDEYDKHADFITNYLLNNPVQRFDEAFRNSLFCLDYGVMALEKVWMSTYDDVLKRDVVFMTYQYRAPSSYEKWAVDKGEKCVRGLTQQLPNGFEYGADTWGDTERQIPWQKLIIFWNDREGEDYWGQSILRSVYKHWYYKDTLYRIDAIAAERTGIGIPCVTMPENNTAQDRTDASNMIKNMRANSQAGVVKPNPDWVIEFITTGGQSATRDLMPSIVHHDWAIGQAMLMTLLFLGRDSGTQALGQTLRENMLLSIEGFLKNEILSKWNEVIKELIDLNFGEQEKYPTLSTGDLGNVDINILSLGLERLGKGGFITPDDELEDFLRQKLDFPERQEEEESQDKTPDKTPDKTSDKPKEQPKEKEIPEDEGEVKENMKLNLFQAGENKKKRIRKRERDFVLSISENETKLEEQYSHLLKNVEKAETQIKKYLKAGFMMADTTREGGVLRIKKQGNMSLQSEMLKGVDKIIKQLRDKEFTPEIAKKKITKAAERGSKTYIQFSKNVKLDQILVLPEGQINSYIAGYRSNIIGNVVDTDTRQVKEVIVDVFGQEAPLEQVMQNVDNIKFNRNNLYLSETTHARGVFKRAIENAATKDGFNKFKMVIPKQAAKDLSPSGFTAHHLFLIGELTYWATRKKDTVSNPLGFTAHHNSKEYYKPIPDEDYEYELELAREQREKLKNKLTKK